MDPNSSKGISKTESRFMTLFGPSPETAGNPYSRVAVFCTAWPRRCIPYRNRPVFCTMHEDFLKQKFDIYCSPYIDYFCIIP